MPKVIYETRDRIAYVSLNRPEAKNAIDDETNDSRVVPADQLLTEAETVARQILRNSQHAIRSAKETILDMTGRALDEQLRVEALLMVTPRSSRTNPPHDSNASTAGPMLDAPATALTPS